MRLRKGTYRQRIRITRLDVSQHARKDLHEALMRGEWSGRGHRADGGIYPACPVCSGGHTEHVLTPADNRGHKRDCRLNASLLAQDGRVR